MSMETSIVYGYGFEIHADDRDLIRFAKNHQTAVEQLDEGRHLIMTYIANGNTNFKEDYYDLCCGVSGREGAYSLVSNVMRIETGIRFQYEPGDAECDSTDSILLVEQMPWQMNEVERNLTEEQLETIVKRYVDELGIVTTTGFLGVEYYG